MNITMKCVKSKRVVLSAHSTKKHLILVARISKNRKIKRTQENEKKEKRDHSRRLYEESEPKKKSICRCFIKKKERRKIGE
jgi:hypothetical protein